MDAIIFVLMAMVFVQGFMIFIKQRKVDHKEDLAKVNELMGYIDRKEVDLFDKKGLNPLMVASTMHFYKKSEKEYDYNDVTRNAIGKKLDLEKQNPKDGKTALFYALRNPNGKEAVKLLLEAGANVDAVDKNGRTPLFEAVKFHKYDLVKDEVKDIDHQGNDGITPLMLAASNMDFETIEDLLERGADPKTRNMLGENAYDVAHKNMGRHIRVAIESQNSDEGGKPQNITTSKDVKAAQEHNHRVREMARRLECLANDIEYRPEKYKRPFFNTGKAK